MYAVISTGGKQYRVRPGDVIVVEKLEGDVGAAMTFDKILMMGGDSGAVLGDALSGATVSATLIETRKGEKVKVFKKIRRQGYRKTQGHRQFESVLRITGLAGGGQEAKWDGAVDLTPRSELLLRARGLATTTPAAATTEAAPAAATALKAKAAPAPEAATPAEEAPAPAPKKAKAPKAAVEQPISETPETGAQTDVDAAAAAETGSMAAEEAAAAAPKKPRAKKAKPAAEDTATHSPDSEDGH